ncbi:hypothetical protein ES319_A08G066500v1 [Gossypium barbadense]|uniref:Fe2OG dioxygenase domain-containing protein n=1 Tax=Gossypium barbadense TaxID=3634 RepID=A0A5J5ULY5_GOSBA|nr:hypothetical protein ES319_A08G066500v1 [Gossypium barbadense]
MERLVSNWYNHRPLPESYICPPETRPGKLSIPSGDTIPVVSLGEALINRSNTILNVLRASQEFGFFQVVNHGVSEKVLNDTMNVVEEFFKMPMEEKASLYSEDPNKVCRLYTSNINYGTEKYHFWRDILKHHCHPLDDCIKLWPQKPTRYSEAMLLVANHYPPCPDPSLTLGLPKHCDPNLITILLQGHTFGLQVFKDGQWIGVQPLPNALVVNIGHQLRIVSNNKLKSAEHRAVTNSKVARTTVGLFISSSEDSIIEPAKSLTNAAQPPLYRAFRYKEFLSYYFSMMGDTELALQPFKLPFNQSVIS